MLMKAGENGESTKTNSSRIIVGILLITVSAAFLLVACTATSGSSGDSVIDEEAIIEVNAKVILEYFDEVGFSERSRTHDDLVKEAAALLAKHTDCQIITSVTSKLIGNRDTDLTIVGEKGETFIVGMGPIPTVGSIRDADANYLFLTII